MLLSLVLVAASAMVPGAVRAAPDMVTVSILPGWRMTDGSHMAALRFVLAPGWKTYWRAPGEAGIPPRFDWRGSRNVAAVEILWPTPQQTTTNGLRTIGYAHELVLPVRVTPARAGQAVALSGDLEIGVCSEVCVPVETQVSLDLPLSGGNRDPRIAAALAARPYTAAEAGVGHVRCQVAPIEGGMELRAEIEMAQRGAQEMVVVESGDPDLWVAQADTARSGNRISARTAIYHVDGRGFVLDRGALRFTVLSRGDAVDIAGCTGR
ncbi:DsbC/DsbD-like thiol-disulfide interchange protein [Roseovarius sp. MBR-78]|jgi:DsbC/DsbD-like thiol-disulfide interchange protein|uniref:protein-disulfide reductase DsbD domain-containing protein n=1 Tax=Roseovarius sp. MBR-78 TaxID=3156460 RepID=UPI00339A84A1